MNRRNMAHKYSVPNIIYSHIIISLFRTRRCKKNACFSNNCSFVYFQYKKSMSTPKQPVINAVWLLILITQLRKIMSERWRPSCRTHSPQPLLTVLHHIYLPAISFSVVTSNQKSTFENLVQSTI